MLWISLRFLLLHSFSFYCLGKGICYIKLALSSSCPRRRDGTEPSCSVVLHLFWRYVLDYRWRLALPYLTCTLPGAVDYKSLPFSLLVTPTRFGYAFVVSILFPGSMYGYIDASCFCHSFLDCRNLSGFSFGAELLTLLFMTHVLFVGLTGRQWWVSVSSQVKEEEVTGRKGTLFICEGTKCQSGTVGRI